MGDWGMATAQEFEKILDKSDTKVASFTHSRSPLEKLQHFLHANNAMAPLIILVLSLIAFGILIDFIPIGMGWRTNFKFFNAFTLTLIIQQVAITGIVGAAQTIVVLTAGIDLSVGAVMTLSSIVMGQFTFRYGLPVPVAILCGLACGTLCGWINGWLVSRMKLPPFIVTLGTWQVFSAVKYIYSKNETIRTQDIEQQAPLLQFFGIQLRIGNAIFPLGVIFMVLLVVFLWYVLFYTAWGRRLYAVGDDPDSAGLSGVPVNRMLIGAYAISGLICGMAGWVLIGRIGSVSPTAGEYANIESITAVVIGGISLFGGRGSILGMIFGGLTVGVYSLGLRLIGADPQYTYLFIGILIIAAVAIDQWIRKVSG
jgi:fructose transport system permease protein